MSRESMLELIVVWEEQARLKLEMAEQTASPSEKMNLKRSALSYIRLAIRLLQKIENVGETTAQEMVVERIDPDILQKDPILESLKEGIILF